MDKLVSRRGTVIQNPRFVDAVLNSKKFAWVWLLARVWVGLQWIEASQHKIFNEAWVGSGVALKGFWTSAVAIPAEGRPPIAFGWYRAFLQAMLDMQAYTWFAKLVAYGELLIGIALIIGAFTGIAAFFGAFMNWNFMMAGSASINPMLFALSVGLILAWKVAGYVGADYFLLPLIGTPWGERHAAERAAKSGALVPEGAGAGD
jgi:thiosulfate dehydrogenase [quinone] large subunit